MVAHSHSATRIAGSIAGRPATPSTALIFVCNGSMSSDCTNAHTVRAA